MRRPLDTRHWTGPFFCRVSLVMVRPMIWTGVQVGSPEANGSEQMPTTARRLKWKPEGSDRSAARRFLTTVELGARFGNSTKLKGSRMKTIEQQLNDEAIARELRRRNELNVSRYHHKIATMRHGFKMTCSTWNTSKTRCNAPRLVN